MKTKICIILLTFASNANAGRHAISREVAQQVVETRFAQHYRDEGRLKEIENEAMASAIASAKELEAEAMRNINEDEGGESFKSSTDSEGVPMDNPDFSSDFTRNDEEGNNSGQQSFAENGGWGGEGSANYTGDGGEASANNTGSDSEEYSQKNINGITFNEGILTVKSMSESEKNNEMSMLAQAIASGPDSYTEALKMAANMQESSPEMAAKFKKMYKEITGIDLKKKQSKDENIKQKLASVSASSAKKEKGKELFPAAAVFEYETENLHKVYAAKGKTTTIMLAPNESLQTSPILGDDRNWELNSKQVGDRLMLMVKPSRANLATNLTLISDQGRIYLLDMVSQNSSFMALVQWKY
jgi:hypothetical protein